MKKIEFFALIAVLFSFFNDAIAQSPSATEPSYQATPPKRESRLTGAVGAAAELNIDRPERELERGVKLLNEGHTEEAKLIFESLVERYPNQPSPYVNLAAIHVRSKNLTLAREQLEKALERAPERASIQESLANVYLALTWNHLKQANALGHPIRNGDERLKMLEKLLLLTRAEAAEPPQHASSAADETRSPDVPEKQETTDAEIKRFIEHWRKTWMQREITAYTDLYATDFTPANNESRKHWTSRKEKIFKQRPIEIEVKIEEINIQSKNLVLVKILQNYKSGSYKSVEEKMLKIIKENNQWKIASEQILRH